MLRQSLQPSDYHIVLLRHGESVGNADGYHQGQSEFSLTELGQQQTQALADRWKSQGLSFDHMISSPLLRAKETAEIIVSALDIQLEFDPVWMEVDIGVLSGLHYEEAEHKYPRPDFFHLYQRFGKTGESRWELFLRAGQAVNSLLVHDPGSYLVVSHGGILNMVIYAMLGITPQANFLGPHFRFGNTAFATLTYTPAEHKWSIWGVNDQVHLNNLDT
jgi:broad specificity phosphatase PhoE